ncbi:MAG TPA: (d)CMP kinase [Candidatus Tripitaka californicus]|uniref:(d)CMP kinase n=1 Tax=Candidatus Tripitaka californicus TaxID=3367616 RepID=UPI004027C4D3|nr:(d)CMP kinase [Planctomycetota bacterium]
MIITIDGPAGSGKSTVAQTLAKRLGYRYIDTGAFYRAFTLKAMRVGVNMKDEALLKQLLQETKIELRNSEGGTRVFLDGKDVSEAIRTPEVTGNIHYIASRPALRERLVEQQRMASEGVSAVAEGRDTGTVVFPSAERKFYLDAGVEERARRRYLELLETTKGITYQDVLEELKKRDERDTSREASPLKMGDDFIYFDTTDLAPEEVVEVLLKKI